MSNRIRTLGISSLVIAIAGCAATSENMEVGQEQLSSAQGQIEAIEREREQRRQSQQPKIEEIGSFYADRSARDRESGDWLKDIPFTMEVNQSQGDLSLRQIMQVFAGNGVNMTNAIAIDNRYYSGTSIIDTNAKSALRVILGNMGLDYTVDDESKIVTVNSMPRKAYYLSLNNRSSTYSSGSSGVLASGGEEGEDGASEADLGITANNDFWNSLETEMESRCSILVPSYGDPVFLNGGGGQASNTGGDPNAALVDSLQMGAGSRSNVIQGEREEVEQELVCLTSINRNTGTVTVHGPSWVQDDMDAYFERLNRTLNTRITLEAKIVLFTSTAAESAGLDLSAFAGSLADTGLAIQNNVLGGVTLGASGNMASISGNTNELASSYLGARINGAQAFIGWLESKGSVSIENEPVITTVSGVPTTFKRTEPIVYFRYSQESTANEGGSVSVSITSEEVERTVGSILNVNPTYDMDRNVVRTQIGVNQRYLTGWEDDISYLAVGDEIRAVPVRVPLIESIVLNGEILLRDGETIIVGGQKFNTADRQENGISNVRENSLFGGLFGSSQAQEEVVTYYTILTLQVDESPNEMAVRL
jgi:type II secretory pathway component GspD/PulD (secretin)